MRWKQIRGAETSKRQKLVKGGKDKEVEKRRWRKRETGGKDKDVEDIFKKILKQKVI